MNFALFIFLALFLVVSAVVDVDEKVTGDSSTIILGYLKKQNNDLTRTIHILEKIQEQNMLPARKEDFWMKIKSEPDQCCDCPEGSCDCCKTQIGYCCD